MIVIVAQIFAAAAFALGTAVLSLRVHRRPDRYTARHALREHRLLVGSCLVAPALFGVVYPGLGRYDALLGLPALPFGRVGVFAGAALVPAGLLLMIAARRHATARRRAGCRALYKLSRKGLYRKVRHPMTLGGYLVGVGAGLLAGSTAVTLGSLLLVLPLHVVSLLFVEEPAQEVLRGSAYASYRRRVPLLIPRPPQLANLFSS